MAIGQKTLLLLQVHRRLARVHDDPLGVLGRDDATDEVGVDRDLAVAPVDQDGQADRARAAILEDGVQRCANGASGEQHIVHQENVPALRAGSVSGEGQRVTVAVVAVGVAAAWFLVGKREIPTTPPSDVSFVTKAARADIYGDAINEGLVVEPGRRLTGALLTFDRTVVGLRTVLRSRGPLEATRICRCSPRTRSP